MAGRLPSKGTQNQNPDNLPEETSQQDRMMQWLQNDATKKRIVDVASKALTPVRFLRLLNVAVYKTEKLVLCDKASVLRSIIEAAAGGFELGSDAHLVPYKRKDGSYECQMIVDYRGLRKAVIRGGLVQRMKCGVVFEGETYTLEEGGLVESFEYTPRLDLTGSEPMLFAWARAWFKDGTSQFCIVRRFEVLRSMAASMGSSSAYSPWVKYPDRMWAKTALRRLCNEIGLSDEAQEIIAKDDAQTYGGSMPLNLSGDGVLPEATTPKLTIIDNPDSTPDLDERPGAPEEDADPEGSGDAPEPEVEPEATNEAVEEPKDPPVLTPKQRAAKKAEEKKAKEDAKEALEAAAAKGGETAKLVEAIVAQAEKQGLTEAMVLLAAYALEEAKFEGELGNAKGETLEKLSKLLKTEKGAIQVEEWCTNWEEKSGAAE